MLTKNLNIDKKNPTLCKKSFVPTQKALVAVTLQTCFHFKPLKHIPEKLYFISKTSKNITKKIYCFLGKKKYIYIFRNFQVPKSNEKKSSFVEKKISKNIFCTFFVWLGTPLSRFDHNKKKFCKKIKKKIGKKKLWT